MVGLRQIVVAQGGWTNASLYKEEHTPVVIPSGGSFRKGAERRLAGLVRAVENEVIPRLFLAENTHLECSCDPVADHGVTSEEDIAAFAALLLSDDVNAASAFVEAQCRAGVSLDFVYLDLLAPAARKLGDLWNEDLCDFTQVTVGLWRLQQLVRDLSPSFQHMTKRPHCGCRALLSPAPGEQHTFGLYMVAEFLRRAGWMVAIGPSGPGNFLAELVHNTSFAIIGFSLSCDDRIEELGSRIRELRRASRNQALGVLVGGRVFNDCPDYVHRVGADATAIDGRQIATQAENLVDLLTRR